ncbi:MAG: DUF192 domain-containing protein [Patescibacteria group bacterium]
MNESKSNINKIVIFTVGFIGVVVLLIYIISSKTLPSLEEFMADSTSGISENNTNEAASTTNLAVVDPSEVSRELGTYATTTIRAPKGDIQVEISDTQDKMEFGLSNRTSLEQNSGMLFSFQNSQPQSFWMKDMLFPLDIVWINSDKEVTGVTHDLSPDSYPEAFDSPGEVQYVLELNAGGANNFGIATGTLLQF